MKIIVQKFGGTSLKTNEIRAKAVGHVKEAVDKGLKVIVVVSAMGRHGDPYATDTLLELIDPNIVEKREQDLLLSCGEIISAVVFTSLLQTAGLKATAMTGAQAGFKTNEDFSNAKIIEMQCEHLFRTFERVDAIVIAGFQGQSKTGEITTLGRGGSDTSATALGAAVGAEWVDIFTDVGGVMSADPQIVESARPLKEVTYNEICNMAYLGAKVIHPRAVEIAMQAQIPIHIRSTSSDDRGTLITADNNVKKGNNVKDQVITGIAHLPNITQIKVVAKEGQFDLQEQVFKAMANDKISVDFININPFGVIYTISDDCTERAVKILKSMGYEPQVTRDCAKVSVVGAGMMGVPGVTAKIVSALSKENIQILQSADSHTTIWVLVNGKDMVKAVNALHEMFELTGG